jgi:RNA polymerase sigma-70 factor (ECF subfamily)
MSIDIASWYEKYGPMVIRRCRGILGNGEDAMDAVQDVFLNLIRGEARIHDSFPSSLLYTMATNVCLNRLRKKKRQSALDNRVGFFAELSAGPLVMDQGFDQVEAEILMELVLKDESELNRTICFMYYADGMTFREIGEAAGLSISGVRKKLEAFKKRARSRIGEDRI